MLYSFQVEGDMQEKMHSIYVDDGFRTYRLIARAEHTMHVYTNLPVSKRPRLTLPFPASVSELSCGPDSYMSSEQKEKNGSLIGHDTPYLKSVRGNPKRAVITFPHYKGHGGWPAPFPVFDGEKLGLDDCLYLSFQDPYFHLGSYLLSDNFGADPKPGVLNSIRGELKSYGLKESDVSLFGASKGAATALMVSEYLEGNQLVVCSLSTDLDVPIRKSLYSHLGTALDYYGITYPSTIDLLLSEAEKKDVHWFYSIGDDAANCGNEVREARYLSKYPSPVEHARVAVTNLPKIADLVSNR